MFKKFILFLLIIISIPFLIIGIFWCYEMFFSNLTNKARHQINLKQFVNENRLIPLASIIHPRALALGDPTDYAKYFYEFDQPIDEVLNNLKKYITNRGFIINELQPNYIIKKMLEERSNTYNDFYEKCNVYVMYGGGYVTYNKVNNYTDYSVGWSRALNGFNDKCVFISTIILPSKNLYNHYFFKYNYFNNKKGYKLYKQPSIKKNVILIYIQMPRNIIDADTMTVDSYLLP